MKSHLSQTDMFICYLLINCILSKLSAFCDDINFKKHFGCGETISDSTGWLASNQRVGLQTRDGKKQLKIQMEFQLLNLKTSAWHIETDKKSKLFLFSLM